MDEREIRYSENTDGSDNINLRDYVSEALVRVYPYRAVNGKKNKTLLDGNGGSTFVTISQDAVDDFNHLTTDENGNKYFEIFAAVDISTQQKVSLTTSTFKKDLRNVRTLSCITSNFVDSDEYKIDFFTIGETFDEVAYLNDKQSVFYSTNIKPSYPEILIDLADQGFKVEEENRIVSMDLSDVTNLEESNNGRLFFSLQHYNTTNVSNILIKTLPDIMIDRIKVKALSEIDNELIDIDFKSTSDNLGWIQVVPIETKDKVSVTIPWLDSNITLNKKIAERILEKGSSMKWTDFCNEIIVEGSKIDDSLKDLVLDMVLYTYEFTNEFGQVPRTSEGAAEPKWVIGTKNTFVSAVANKDGAATVTSLYRKWRKIYPSLVGSEQEKVVKAFVAALSQSVIGELSVAGGENDLNKSVLPWRLKLTKELDIKTVPVKDKPEQGTIRLEDFEFTVDESPYYEVYGPGSTQDIEGKEVSATTESSYSPSDLLPNFSKTPFILGSSFKIKWNSLDDKNSGEIDAGNTLSGEVLVYKGGKTDEEGYFKCSMTPGAPLVVEKITKTDYENSTLAKLSSDKYGATIITSFAGGWSAQINNIAEIDMSEAKFIEGERRIVLPELPEVISPIDKLNNVGDFATTSSRDLRYMLKAPLTSTELDALYEGKTKTGPQTLTIKNQKLPDKFNEYTEQEAKALITNQIRGVYTDAYDIQIVKKGSSQVVNDPNKYTWGSSWEGTKRGWWIFKGRVGKKEAGTRAIQNKSIDDYITSNKVNLTPIGGIDGPSYKAKQYELDYLGQPNAGFLYYNSDNLWLAHDTKGGAKISNVTDHFTKMLNIFIGRALGIKDLTDITSVLSYSNSTSTNDVFFVDGRAYQNFGYRTTIRKHTWAGYEYTFKTNLASQEIISRQTIYDRPKWKQLVKSVIDPAQGLVRTISLEEKYDIGPYDVNEIAFSSLFGDKIWLDFGDGIEREVKLDQREDETASTHRIYFY